MFNENIKQNTIKATIKYIIVAFVYVAIIWVIIYFLFGDTISRAISLIDMVSIRTNEKILNDVTIDLKTKNLRNYPEYGEKYGEIEIPSLNIFLPLYFGDTLDVLKHGVGHSSFSYFPGEGGSVLCMAHNSSSMFKKLPEIQIGDMINIETSYGRYEYKVYDTKIVNENDLNSAPIQREKEILMLYTCYPVNGIGHATKRFFVYANLINEEIFDKK